MKNYLRIICFVLLAVTLVFPQQAKIKIEPVTPHSLVTLGLNTNSVASGLRVVPNETYVYLSAQNIGGSDPVLSADFTFDSKPAGSAATIEVVNTTWVQFKVDLKGEYVVHLTITTAGGTDDTTQSIYSSDFVGVGNFAGVQAIWPNCMSCHSGFPEFQEIFSRWEVSGHANIFNEQITTSTHYGPSCMACHTTGYDKYLPAANNGFDDIAAQLGWTYTTSSPSTWDSLVTYYPTLVNHATIGCESCHGPGSLHASSTDVKKIQISLEAGNCAQCHDEPWRHDIYAMFENSKHSEAVWSNSFAQGSSSQNNSLGNCIRCHDARGYVNFTKGLTTNTTGMVEADHNFITCPSCHDPHGNDQDYALRKVPVGSDTLANGFQYTAFGGLGQVCLNCHKGRKDNVSYTVTPPNNSHWGPHHSTQGDIFLGQNAALFGTTPYPTNTHKYAVTNACVDCHMYATTDTGTVTRDRVGGHSWNMNDPDNNFDNTAACYSCHGPLNSFEDFIAPADYDGDGTVESIPEEFDGTLANLRYWLPPTGVDSVDWQLIQQFNNETITKAYFNYLLIEADGSSGLHNSKFEFAVLLASIQALGGVVPVELTSFNAVLNDKTVNLDWETASETNNRGFEVQKKSGNSWVKIGFVNGNGTTSDIKQYAYTDKLDESQISGKITYRLQQVDYDGKTQLSKEVSVEFTSGPKEFALLQNYPNPFNPTTNIQFTLPYESKVKLVVYNITGQVVSELINSVQAAGEHSVQFSTAAVNVASGIYFYTIEASSLNGSKTFRQTKKMVLLK